MTRVLINHARTAVEKSSLTFLATIDRRLLSSDALELLRAKNAALHRAYAYTTADNRSRAWALQRRMRKISLEPQDDLSPVSLNKVQKLVKKLKIKKAPGLDGINNKAIKCFPLKSLSLLVAIFNTCLKNCHFPPVWKEVEVIGIHKPGKPLHSQPAIDESDSLAVYEKNFKAQLKVPDRLIHIIHAYITIRHFMFQHENTHSSRRLIREGVPQGSTLFPLMYFAYTNDIPLPSADIQLAIFADDIAMYMRGKTVHSIYPHLQRAIDEMVRRFQIWRMERFFSIAVSQPNPLLSAAAFYETPPPYHFIRRPRNALTDLPDVLTSEVEMLIDCRCPATAYTETIPLRNRPLASHAPPTSAPSGRVRRCCRSCNNVPVLQSIVLRSSARAVQAEQEEQ
ncbi:RNA-directed DNA polymerase from mobile element jockey [Eumeta japonica]|uniref:RNA-directed DNA polymerase from mobile element jockey n=1 Tax=Eumeta variegata TaxID=151549 RepID=A0A4C1SWR8_EUMVA|nr:RNA-directed DNA polymerase from mobile element jockey [Eumeta japonica]